MANYLVTGAAGFIGSNLVERLLERGDAVRGVDDFSTGYRRNLEPFLDRMDLLEGDLRDPDVCRRSVADMDYVLHHAAIPSVPRSVADPLETHEADVTATVHLLLAAREAGVKRFVYAASSSAYGDSSEEFKTEDLRPEPFSPYAVAKLACEHYLRAFSACYGMETVSLRYFNVFGPRQDPNSEYSAVIPRFIQAILEGGRPTIYGDGRQARDFTYVDNNVEGNILAAEADYEARGQVYNIACGESIDLIALLDGVNQALGTSVEAEFAPARVGDILLSKADISRARRDLGYEVGVSFQEGLKRTAQYYREILGGAQ